MASEHSSDYEVMSAMRLLVCQNSSSIREAVGICLQQQVLSPPGVEGASLPTSTTHVQDKDKKPMHDEGPSGEQEADFILIQDDNADVESAQLRMNIQEQNTEIQDLSLNVERAKWIIKYLEQRKK